MPQSKTKQRKRSQRGRETEKKFLDAGNEVFWKQGFAASTIAQIVETGGLSVGSFYHLFKDKHDLLACATERLMLDFEHTLTGLDLSIERNHDLFTMLFHVTLEGRQLVARNRGIYRATAELAQSRIEGFGRMRGIGPAAVIKVAAALPDYSDQSPEPLGRRQAAHVIQLIAMSVLQTELGMGPLYPDDTEEFAQIIARACCGIVNYHGQTTTPALP